MFGVHVDGWTYRVVVASAPNEVVFTHFTGNDRWDEPFPGLLMQGNTNLITWEAAARGT